MRHIWNIACPLFSWFILMRKHLSRWVFRLLTIIYNLFVSLNTIAFTLQQFSVRTKIAYSLYQSNLVKKYRNFILCTGLFFLILVIPVSLSRQIGALNQFNYNPKTLLLKNFTSDRAWLWQLSLQSISKRPWLGWGFDGFGIAYPHIVNPHHIPKVLHLGDLSYDYMNKDGQLRTQIIPTYKAHNLILDTTISVGILGMLTYSALLGFSFWCVIKSPFRGMETVAIVYLIFTFTWFDCAQFTHLPWWLLSFTYYLHSGYTHGVDGGLAFP
ncbi:MAG TPA: hypothetical protein DEG17_26700 [Cyanobacteria bacterium UBA11149]|nr:hypothetical protein [Cyanobacteria bacterium UBA11367]HBE60920.1 hypothetical protein [Cyanobacteria bacterium UBA11366]HBK62421.1 hypothetical protein [Cyanobacteria bacterium UBA11166]HBR76383.1 hypothetical protein [Cyanobacteria bacterium UBA11159]HBS72038.1 hypothetical protein [Cyanobacteria bacterium UBA11153]HBW92359.1 hypothetical protein [Cyanobacteria bacterium UBA11149]HCA95451.1 hypothetical protein [Cyanobacteria bacterium UBA9226]